jgi:hypothetical protein
MTFPEDENQDRPMSLHDALRWLTGNFDVEEKLISEAPEPPIPTKTRQSIDPKLYEIPRKGAENDRMREWWEEKERSLTAKGGWSVPSDQSYDFGIGRFPEFFYPSYPNFPYNPYPAQRGGISYTTTTTNLEQKEPVATKREEILDEAAKLITQDRQEQYGPPEENFQNIADVWNVRFKNKLSEPLTPADVAAAMALLKIVRDMAGYKEDSAIDAAAYIALYAELSEKESKA